MVVGSSIPCGGWDDSMVGLRVEISVRRVGGQDLWNGGMDILWTLDPWDAHRGDMLPHHDTLEGSHCT